jgi:hypothetical protein
MHTHSSRLASDRCRAQELRSASCAGRDRVDRTPEFDDLVDRFLRQVIENKVVGLDGLQAARLTLVKLFGRIERLQQKIDEAFCGTPFLLNLPPDCPANRRRFNMYFNEHRKATLLIGYALELWSFTCGMKREDDWTPVLVAEINRKAFQEVWRQDPNRNADVSVKSVDQAQAPTEKTDRDKAARKSRRGARATPK